MLPYEAGISEEAIKQTYDLALKSGGILSLSNTSADRFFSLTHCATLYVATRVPLQSISTGGGPL